MKTYFQLYFVKIVKKKDDERKYFGENKYDEIKYQKVYKYTDRYYYQEYKNFKTWSGGVIFQENDKTFFNPFSKKRYHTPFPVKRDEWQPCSDGIVVKKIINDTSWIFYSK